VRWSWPGLSGKMRSDMRNPHLGQFGRTTTTLGGLAKTVAISHFRHNTTEAQGFAVSKFENKADEPSSYMNV
jgi:hypothetical protein